MRLQVAHKTFYRFDPPMRGVVQSLRLRPSQCESQVAVDWQISVEGAVRGTAFRDPAGDTVETLSVTGLVQEVGIEVEGTVETTDTSGVLKGHRESIMPEAYLRETRLTWADPTIKALAEDTVPDAASRPKLEQAHALMAAVSQAVAYVSGATSAQTTAIEALAEGKGVCQDHAHLMIATARMLDIPARYVAGYLFSGEGDARADASHAWAELWIGGLGWVGFDASNNCCPDDRYIRLGSGLDAVDGAPIRGVSLGPGVEFLQVAVEVSAAQQ